MQSTSSYYELSLGKKKLYLTCKNIHLRRKENAAVDKWLQHHRYSNVFLDKSYLGLFRYTLGHRQKILHITKYLFQ